MTTNLKECVERIESLEKYHDSLLKCNSAMLQYSHWLEQEGREFPTSAREIVSTVEDKRMLVTTDLLNEIEFAEKYLAELRQRVNPIPYKPNASKATEIGSGNVHGIRTGYSPDGSIRIEAKVD